MRVARACTASAAARRCYLACAMLFVGVLIDKSLGTIIPGFIPELGRLRLSS